MPLPLCPRLPLQGWRPNRLTASGALGTPCLADAAAASGSSPSWRLGKLVRCVRAALDAAEVRVLAVTHLPATRRLVQRRLVLRAVPGGVLRLSGRSNGARNGCSPARVALRAIPVPPQHPYVSPGDCPVARDGRAGLPTTQWPPWQQAHPSGAMTLDGRLETQPIHRVASPEPHSNAAQGKVVPARMPEHRQASSRGRSSLG